MCIRLRLLVYGFSLWLLVHGFSLLSKISFKSVFAVLQEVAPEDVCALTDRARFDVEGLQESSNLMFTDRLALLPILCPGTVFQGVECCDEVLGGQAVFVRFGKKALQVSEQQDFQVLLLLR
jgi:hypothetical protein